MKRKPFFLFLTTAVLLITTACSGPFIDPGMLDQPSGGSGGFFDKDKDHGGGGGGGGGGGDAKLAAPSNVTASAQSSHSIKISWSAVSGASGYYVYRNTSANGSYSKLNYVSSTSTFYTDNGLQADTTYYYKVSSYNIDGESNLSSYTSAKTSPHSNAEKNPITLTENKWKDGEITSGATDKEVWYSFIVTSGTKYYVWWNDSDSGNNTKTLDVKVDAYYNNDKSIFTNEDTAWYTPLSFTANSDGTVKLKVYPYSSGTGTFAIAYSTSDKRPCAVIFDITGGTGTPPPSQTVGVGSSIKLPKGDGLSKSGYTFGGWTTSNYAGVADDSYTVNSNVTLYAVWISVLTGSGTETDPYQLTEDTWADGVITSSTANKEVWYSFAVTNEVTYNIWWNDHFDGDGTKTLSAYVDVSYSNGSPIFTEDEDKDTAWDSPKQFTANSTGAVKLRVYPYRTTTGTFAIVYSKSITRPH